MFVLWIEILALVSNMQSWKLLSFRHVLISLHTLGIWAQEKFISSLLIFVSFCANLHNFLFYSLHCRQEWVKFRSVNFLFCCCSLLWILTWLEGNFYVNKRSIEGWRRGTIEIFQKDFRNFDSIKKRSSTCLVYNSVKAKLFTKAVKLPQLLPYHL